MKKFIIIIGLLLSVPIMSSNVKEDTEIGMTVDKLMNIYLLGYVMGQTNELINHTPKERAIQYSQDSIRMLNSLNNLAAKVRFMNELSDSFKK